MFVHGCTAHSHESHSMTVEAGVEAGEEAGVEAGEEAGVEAGVTAAVFGSCVRKLADKIR